MLKRGVRGSSLHQTTAMLLLVAALLLVVASAEGNKNNAERWINETCLMYTNGVCLSKNYTKHEIPENPIVVNVSLVIEQVTEVDDDHGTVDILAFVYLYWEDRRLVVNKSAVDDKIDWDNYIILNLEWMEKLWFPDLYIYRMASLNIPEVIKPYKGM